MDFSKREKDVLRDIVRTEIVEVEDMIKDETGDDKAELEDYLGVVRGIFSKLQAE